MKKKTGSVTKAEFARIALVSRTAIGKAVKSGNVIEDKNGKINLRNKRNSAYLENHKNGIAKTQNHADRIRHAKEKSTAKTEKDSPKKKIETNADLAIESYTEDKYAAEVKKLNEQIKKLGIENDRMMRKVIPVEEIKSLFEKQNKVIVSYFHPIGPRTAELIAGIAGIESNETKLKIEKVISEEIIKGIQEFKNALKIRNDAE